MRGRKPKSSAQKLLDGDPGHRPLNLAEPQLPAPEPLAFDKAPDDLDGFPRAAAEWVRLAPMLRRAGQVTDADRAALIAVCLEWDRYLDAMARVKKLGMVVKSPNGYPMVNPYLSIATRALAGCNKLWPELGLTPSSRSRVKMEGPLPQDNLGGDPFAEFDTPPPLPPAKVQ